MPSPEAYTPRNFQEDMQMQLDSQLRNSGTTLSAYNELLRTCSSYDQVQHTAKSYVDALNYSWNFHDSYVFAVGMWRGYDRIACGSYGSVSRDDAEFAGVVRSKGYGIVERSGTVQIGYRFTGIYAPETPAEHDPPLRLYDVADAKIAMTYAGEDFNNTDPYDGIIESMHDCDERLSHIFKSSVFYQQNAAQKLKLVDRILDECSTTILTPHYDTSLYIRGASEIYVRTTTSSPYGFDLVRIQEDGRDTNVDFDATLLGVTTLERDAISSKRVQSQSDLLTPHNGLYLVVGVQLIADDTQNENIWFVPYQEPKYITVVATQLKCA